jgi:hypothetical protein
MTENLPAQNVIAQPKTSPNAEIVDNLYHSVLIESRRDRKKNPRIDYLKSRNFGDNLYIETLLSNEKQSFFEPGPN